LGRLWVVTGIVSGIVGRVEITRRRGERARGDAVYRGDAGVLSLKKAEQMAALVRLLY
jgi:hypothetical protein